MTRSTQITGAALEHMAVALGNEARVQGDVTKRTSELEVVVFLYGKKFTFPLPLSGTVRVGRSPTCDLRVEHYSVSRAHLAIHLQDGHLEAEDLGSRNGTRIYRSGTLGRPELGEETHNSPNDWLLSRGERIPIDDGDMLRLGGVLLRIERTSPIAKDLDAGEEAIVVDPKTQHAFELARRIALSDLPVLLLGETGVGKNVLARVIHEHSSRASYPFVRAYCAALTPNALDGLLPRSSSRSGEFSLLTAASGGTVLLDEVGELPLSTQGKLLDVLETALQTRGADSSTPADGVRFLATSNGDLAADVAAGRFRKDLFFRLNGVSLTLAPLRERPRDIEPLARHFLRSFCARANIAVPELLPAELDRLRAHSWPGNVRELKNMMERLAFLTDDTSTRLLDNPLFVSSFPGDDAAPPSQGAPTSEVSEKSRRDAQRLRVIQALDECGGNQTRAAKLLGISRRTLVNWLNELELPRPRKHSN